jgi:hypothetical protein
MSDLTSRESLIEALKTFDEKFELQKDDVFELITNAPAIAQGEVVGKLEIKSNDGYFIITPSKLNSLRENFGLTDLTLYTTPQQPQSVADALEEVKRIVLNDEIAISYQTLVVTEVRCFVPSAPLSNVMQ